jgi:hypothetical protein
MADFSRRDFVRAAGALGLAGIAGDDLAAQPGVVQPPRKVSLFVMGLCFAEETSKDVTIGFLTEPDHQTVLVVDNYCLATTGTAPDEKKEYDPWNMPEKRVFTKHTDYTVYKPTTSLTISYSSNTSFKGGLKKLFPLTNYSGLATRWKSSCSYDWTLTDALVESAGRTSTVCEHPKAYWDQTDGSSVQNRNWLLHDYLRVLFEAKTIEVKVDNVAVPFKPTAEIKMWLGNMAKTTMGHDPSESSHCRHYFALLQPPVAPVWPKRQTPLPAGCSDSDPVFCPPAF